MTMRRWPLATALLCLLCLLCLGLPARAEEGPAGEPAAKGAAAPEREVKPAPAEEAAPKPPATPTLDAELLREMRWRPVGPATMGGRITSIAVNEQDPTQWWVATASGGLVKTSDNGITFEHQFDHEAVVSIGDVAVARSDPRIVWVGSGECNPRNSVSWGNGVYKSVDGGATWKHMGLDRTFQIGAVRVHPSNPDIVYVGACGRLWGPNEDRGLYKTADGGKTWAKILYVDDQTGVVDVQLHPQDPETLLVATYERQRDGYCSNDPAKKWGPGSGLHKSTDGGRTWTRITEGLPSGQLGRIGIEYYRKDPRTVFLVLESERIGLEPENAPYLGVNGENADVGARLTRIVEKGPAAQAALQKDDIVISVDGETVHSWTDFLRAIRQHVAGDTVKLEVSRERKGVVVELTLAARPEPKKPAEAPQADGAPERPRSPFGAFLGGQRENLQDQQGDAGREYGGVYKSTDGGDTWTRVNSVNPRPMYFSEIRVDPNDENHIWVLGIRLWKSTDGGKTFQGNGAPGDVHVDHHALWVDPTNGRHLILGNDGGIYVSYDRGARFDHLNHVAIGQFYDVGLGPRRDYRIYGGLQDNGSWGGASRVPHGAGPTNEDWIRISGGDGFRVRVDAQDPERIYFQSQNGNVGRRHLETGERAMMRPRPPKGETYRFNWYTPFILSHHNSRIYYTAGNCVFRSLDRGQGMRAISPEVCTTERGSATTLAESPLDPALLYVGTDDGGLWQSKDGGHTWSDLYAAGPAPAPSAVGGAEAPAAEKAERGIAQVQAERRYVSWIEPSRHKAGRVYLVFDGHRSDDDRPLVFVSEDEGATWRGIASTLPARAGTTRVLREDLVHENLLYLGTEFGAWVSVDRGATWTSLHTNLPTVAVHQFAQHPLAPELVAATHGRSLWVLDVTVLRQLGTETLGADVHLFEPAVAIHWRPEPGRGRARTFQGENPPTGLALWYRLAKKGPPVTLTIHKADGTLLRTLEASAEAGLHRVQWDLRGAKEGRQRVARRVPPGTYRVDLTVGDSAQSREIRVELDPAHPQAEWMTFEDQAEEAEAQRQAERGKRDLPREPGREE